MNTAVPTSILPLPSDQDISGRTFGNSGFPFSLAAPEALDYSPELFPGTLEALSRVLVLPWSERYEPKHVDYIGEVIRSSVERLLG